MSIHIDTHLVILVYKYVKLIKDSQIKLEETMIGPIVIDIVLGSEFGGKRDEEVNGIAIGMLNCLIGKCDEEMGSKVFEVLKSAVHYDGDINLLFEDLMTKISNL